MKVIPFQSMTTPWRVFVPARFAADGKRKAKYFKTKEAAEQFCRNVKRLGTGASPELLIGYKYSDLWRYVETYYAGNVRLVLIVLEDFRKKR